MPREFDRRNTVTYLKEIAALRKRLNYAWAAVEELKEKIDPDILDEAPIRRAVTFLSEFEPDSPVVKTIKAAVVESYLSRITTQKKREVQHKSNGLIRAINRLTILHKFVIFNPKKIEYLSSQMLEEVISIIEQVGQAKDLNEQGRLLQHAERTLVKRRIEEVRQRESVSMKERILVKLGPEKKSI